MSSKARKSERKNDVSETEVAQSLVQKQPVWRAIAFPSFASSILLWAAFSPLACGWLGWFAPIGWLVVITRPEPVERSGYVALWLSGSLFWLLTLQGIRLAYWPLTFGWIALSLYLAIYIPLFVFITRIFIFHWKAPLSLAAPTAWVGCELARGYIITGFSANLLAHTQAHYPVVIQIADQFGGYGVSFMIMLVAVAGLNCYQMWRKTLTKSVILQTALAFVTLLAAFGYGVQRLRDTQTLADERPPLLRVALIQENAPSFFDSNPERTQLAWLSYLDATREAGQEFGTLDLVIWPESTFTANEPWMEDRTQGQQLPPEIIEARVSHEELKTRIGEYARAFSLKAGRVLSAARSKEMPSHESPTDSSRPYLLVGCDAMLFADTEVKRFNAAMLIGPDTTVIDRYDKVHLVMFGEYIPLGPVLSFLGRAFEFPGAHPGTQPKCFEVAGVRLAPSICFESVLPHFLSWQMRTLKRQSKAPDILVNITNDSWFRGSSILDHHLACAILASVEHRRPMLIAANGGLSAWIDGAGRVQALSPRLKKHLILATPYRDSRWGLFQVIGDAPAWFAAGLCGLAFFHPVISHWRIKPIK